MAHTAHTLAKSQGFLGLLQPSAATCNQSRLASTQTKLSTSQPRTQGSRTQHDAAQRSNIIIIKHLKCIK